MKNVNGYLVPDDVDVPEDVFFRAKIDGETVELLGWEGYVDIARQSGMTGFDAHVDATGIDGDGIPYAAVRARVWFGDEAYDAIGSTDSLTNGLEDMVSTAQSRALKRAIRIALGIRRVGETTDPDADDDPNSPSAWHGV